MKTRNIILMVLVCFFLITGTAWASVEEISLRRIGEYDEIPITVVEQIDRTSCGLACMEMALKSFGYNINQEDIRAAGIGSSSGTYPYEIVNYMNSVVGVGTYKAKDLSANGLGSKTFFEEVKSNVKSRTPVFCQVLTKNLPNYRGASKVYKHWVLTHGYIIQAGNTTVHKVLYSDSNGVYKGTFSVDPKDMESAICAHSYWIVSKP